MSNRKQEKRVYRTFNYPNSKSGDKTLLTGIRRVRKSSKLYISGFYVPAQGTTTAFVYKGCLCGKGEFYNLNYPLANTVTNLYGPNNGADGDNIQVVGNYTNSNGIFGCLYQGPLNGSGNWITITPTNAINTICHSTMGNLVVGNYDTASDTTTSKAFIYDIKTGAYYNIINPNAVGISAYGIWYNHCEKNYTICGGYTTTGNNFAYVVDWDNNTHLLGNWQIYSFDNNPVKSLDTHFNGITGRKCGGYNLTGDWIGISLPSNELGFFATVERKKNGQFREKAKWSSVSYPKQLATSGNSVCDDIVIGVYTSIVNDVNGYVSDFKTH